MSSNETGPKFRWTSEKVTELLRLQKEGLRMQEIARRLSGNAYCTKNMVIGKLRRLGVSSNSGHVGGRPRGPNYKPRPRPGKQFKPGPRKLHDTKSFNLPEQLVDKKLGDCTILNVRDDQCRWPYGDPVKSLETFRYCGEPVKFRSSFCPHHHSVAFVSKEAPWRAPYDQTKPPPKS